MLLRLARDYEIEKLHKDCDQYLLHNLKTSGENQDYVDYLLWADQYMLNDALEHAVDQLSRLTLKDQKKLDNFDDIKPATICQIQQRRLLLVETETYESGNTVLPVS